MNNRITWARMTRAGWDLGEINEYMADMGYTFAAIHHLPRKLVGHAYDYLTYHDDDGEEVVLQLERLYCSQHRQNVAAFGFGEGDPVWHGSCDCSRFYEDWDYPHLGCG